MDIKIAYKQKRGEKKLNIRRLAKELYIKELKRQADFKAVKEYLNRLGYVVMFYDEDKPSDVLKEYELDEYCKRCNALTIKDEGTKVVFINKKQSCHEMLYAILHETAHIILGHLDTDEIYNDVRFQEIEADAFAYELLTRARKI